MYVFSFRIIIYNKESVVFGDLKMDILLNSEKVDNNFRLVKYFKKIKYLMFIFFYRKIFK